MNGKTRAIAGAGVLAAVISAAGPVRAQGTSDIVGMSIACSNDRVFTWFRDKHVTIGNSGHLDAHQPHLPARTYSLPPGRTTDHIVGMGISRQDHVYTWYTTGR